MTERIIQRQLKSFFGNYEYLLFNTFIYAWESDFFAISKSGYAVEVEIKCSRADFKNDFKNKTDKHNLLINHKKPAILSNKRVFTTYVRNGIYDPDTYQFRNGDSSYVNFTCPANHLPHKFYYCVPENLISVAECPDYAGLFYIVNDSIVREVKRAPFLHKKQNDLSKVLLSKYYHKHLALKNDVSNFLHYVHEENHKEGKNYLVNKLI